MKSGSLCLITCILVGCSSSSSLQTAPIIEYDKGYDDKYDSQTATLVREQCDGAPAENIRVVIDIKELRKIVALAHADNFFQLPPELKGVDVENVEGKEREVVGKTCVIAPCREYRLKILDAGQINEVHWNCGCGDARPPREIADVVAALDKAIYDSPALSKWKQVSCKRY